MLVCSLGRYCYVEGVYVDIVYLDLLLYYVFYDCLFCYIKKLRSGIVVVGMYCNNWFVRFVLVCLGSMWLI